jgi:hypothetical protein
MLRPLHQRCANPASAGSAPSGPAGRAADKKSVHARDAKKNSLEIERRISRQVTNLLFSASKEQSLLPRRPEDKAYGFP